jgi:hypothetical protein
MNQIEVMKTALNALLKKNGKWGQGHDELEAKAIAALRQAIEVAEKADKEAGFEMWWGEFMPSAFRNRAWEAWSMAHPKVEQAEKVEPVAWLVCFDGRIGGARVTDKLVIWRKEQAEQQVRAELIQSVEPLYTRIKS